MLFWGNSLHYFRVFTLLLNCLDSTVDVIWHYKNNSETVRFTVIFIVHCFNE